MIKLIATDLDGTLFRDDKSFSDDFFDIVHHLSKKDIKTVIATGNQYDLVKNKFNKIEDEAIFLCENGNKIVYQSKVLYEHTINLDDLKEVIKHLLKYDFLMIVLSCNKHAYILNEFKNKEDFINLFFPNHIYVDNFDNIDDDILKISIADFSQHPLTIIDELKQYVPNHLQLVTTGNVWSDIFDKNINKGTGMKFLQDYLHINKEECMAFGDQMNDYHLLLSVEESYAMENGCEEIKNIAKHIAKSNEDDGVVEVMKTLM
jgi:Cof subfamily protein (haloacid dehalogenase superfamily)